MLPANIEKTENLCFHRCPSRGNRWVSLVDEKRPPGKPGIAIYFSSKQPKRTPRVLPSDFGLASREKKKRSASK